VEVLVGGEVGRVVGCWMVWFVELDFETSVMVLGPHRASSSVCVDEDGVVMARHAELVANLAPTEESGVRQIWLYRTSVKIVGWVAPSGSRNSTRTAQIPSTGSFAPPAIEIVPVRGFKSKKSV
jgi:hypothetical protein